MNQLIRIFPFLPFHGKEEFRLVDSFMYNALCITQELRPINLCNRKRQNETTTNHERSASQESAS